MTFALLDEVIYTAQDGTEYRAVVNKLGVTVGRKAAPAVRIFLRDYTDQERGFRAARGWCLRVSTRQRRVTADRLRLVDKK